MSDFDGQTPLESLGWLRDHALRTFEADRREAFKELMLAFDLAYARVERLERLARAQRASVSAEGRLSRSLSVQEREVQARLRPHTGQVSNVVPMHRPKGAA